MQTCTPGPAQDICPDQDDCLQQVLALLPRGRAWGNHDGGPFSGVMLWFWAAFASLLAYANQRICALREEFFCATANETLDVWDTEYGLPDDCEPFPDLCIKVAALGAQRCDYFQEVAAANGWSIDCIDAYSACGSRAGAARAGASSVALPSRIARAGRTRAGQSLGCPALSATGASARAGGFGQSTMIILVFTNASPSYQRPTSLTPRAGRMRAGQRLGCAMPSFQGLECLIERIAPAHAQIVYQGA